MRWRILPLLMLVVALGHFNRLSISVAGAEKIIPEHDVSKEQMGTVYTAFLVVYALFMIPGGWFIDRFGPRAAYLALGFGSAGLVALSGVVGFVWRAGTALLAGLLLVRGLLGLTNAPLHPNGARLVGNWIPPAGAALANGLVTGAACVGMASSYVLFGTLIDGLGWRGAFLASGAFTLLVALLWAALGRDYPAGDGADRPEASAAASLDRLGQLLARPSVWWLTLSYGAVSYFQYLFFYWAEYYFLQHMRMTQQQSRDYSSLLTLAMGAGMVLGGTLSDRAVARLGQRRGLGIVPMAGLVLAALFVVLALLGQTPTAVVGCFALAMAAAGMSEAAYWTTAVLLGGTRGGTAAGILNTGGNAIGLLAPVLTPYLSDAFGWQAALAVAVGVALVGAGLWPLVDPGQRAAGSDGAVLGGHS